MVDSGVLRDYDYLGSDRSARIFFNFLDAGKGFICSVEFDLSTSQTTPYTWFGQGGAELWNTYSLDLVDGVSTCNQLDPLEFAGYTDVRDLLSAIPWGIGYGELVTNILTLQGQVAAAGEDWATEWEPYVFGAYITTDQLDAIEIGYAMGYESDCEVVTVDAGNLVPVPVPSLTLSDEYFEASALRQLTLVEVLAALP